MIAKSPTRVPLDIGPIHFIDIGGIGMSGIAEIMHNFGYKVRGSDAVENASCCPKIVAHVPGARAWV